METPNKRNSAIVILSTLDLGWISPKPTVVNDVNEKYNNVINWKPSVFPLKYS